MAMLVVVPAEPPRQKLLRIGGRIEERREPRMVLQCAELGFGAGIVIRGPGTGEAVLQPQELDQIHGSARFHGTSAVVVYSHSVSRLEVPLDCLADESLGAPGVLALRDHPADDVSREDVDHDVEEEELPAPGPLEPGDVPGPDLVRSRGFKDGN